MERLYGKCLVNKNRNPPPPTFSIIISQSFVIEAIYIDISLKNIRVHSLNSCNENDGYYIASCIMRWQNMKLIENKGFSL